LHLTNTTNMLGTVGFTTTLLGALLAVGLMVYFAIQYPSSWYSATGAISDFGQVRTMILLAVLALLTMIVGTMMTHYGKRIQARGSLSDVRIIEKTPQSQVKFS